MQRAGLFVVLWAACTSSRPTPATPQAPANAAPAATTEAPTQTPELATTQAFADLPRADFNRLAVRANLAVYWRSDANQDGSLQADEAVPLLFYPAQPAYFYQGKFTKAFEAAYANLRAARDLVPQDARLALVHAELDAGRATLVETQLADASATDRAFVSKMLEVAKLVDELYEIQTGVRALTQAPADAASASLLRRNRGPKCVAPQTEANEACTALAGVTKVPVNVYPAAAQAQANFCKTLEALPNADELLTPFTVVREQAGTLVAVPYSTAYATTMGALASELRAAARLLDAATEPALITYLEAAAAAFLSNNWQPADEAWAAMNASNSAWYVRVAPDEVYWEPCARKAGFHLTFARINKASLAWQTKLLPLQQEMEQRIAKAAGKPYAARTVTFHLPDFIDIVVNAGDDRDALGATIGQSLPNWGPVANEGRGRTVAMFNLYQDVDSRAARREQAASLLTPDGLALYPDSTEPGLLSTILHEATHNLGPAHEYAVNGKTDDAAFGGPLASVMEELKAQTGALFLIELLEEKGVVSKDVALHTYVDSLVWAMGHVAQGMYTGAGTRKTYSQVAAIQLGFLIDRGALAWKANAKAANGRDSGAFQLNLPRLRPAIREMMVTVGGLKARGDAKGAQKLAALYVDGKVVPHKHIAERYLRFPKASFVFAVQ